MNWDDPAERFRLAMELGPANYNEQFRIHLEETTIGVVNGYPIRPVSGGRFGRLFAVDGTDQAFPTLLAAEAHAATLSPGYAAIGLATTVDDLSELYTRYCKAEGLAPISADEHIPSQLPDHQRSWISAFIVRWDKVQQAEDQVAVGAEAPSPEGQPRDASATIVTPLRHLAAIIAGLDLLRAHADDGYENSQVLDVGDFAHGLAPLDPAEIALLRETLAATAEELIA